MTPIQELAKHFTDAWSSPGDLWNPSKVIEKIESMVEKEKDFAGICFDAGQKFGINLSVNAEWAEEPTESDFETFYSQLTKGQ